MEKNTKKKVYVASLVATLNTALCGCTAPVPRNADELASFAYKKVTDVQLMDGEACQVFNGSNITIYIDSENAISSVYLNYNYLGNILGYTTMVDLDGNFICCSDIFAERWSDDAIDFDTVVPFYSLDEYIEGFESKEWYTREEIDSIVPQVVQTNQKIKELEDEIYN